MIKGVNFCWRKILPVRALCEKCPNSEIFWSLFFPYISPYSVQMQENTEQKNSEYGHFSRSGGFPLKSRVHEFFWSRLRKLILRKFSLNVSISRRSFHEIQKPVFRISKVTLSCLFTEKPMSNRIWKDLGICIQNLETSSLYLSI